GFFVSLHVTVPVLSFGDVVRIELPVLPRLVEPAQETVFLFVLRNVQPELQDRNAVARKVNFLVTNGLKPLVPKLIRIRGEWQPLVLQDPGMYSHYQHFFILAAVEDSDASAFG